MSTNSSCRRRCTSRRRLRHPRVERGRLRAGPAGLVRHHEERPRPATARRPRTPRPRERGPRVDAERVEHAGLRGEVVDRPGRHRGREPHDEPALGHAVASPRKRHEQGLVGPAGARAVELDDLVPGVGPLVRAPGGEPAGELRVVPAGQSCHTRRDVTESRRHVSVRRRARSSPPTSRSATRSSRPTPGSRRPIGRGPRRCARWRRRATARCRSRSASGKYTNRNVFDGVRGRVARQGAVDGPRRAAA